MYIRMYLTLQSITNVLIIMYAYCMGGQKEYKLKMTVYNIIKMVLIVYLYQCKQ